MSFIVNFVRLSLLGGSLDELRRSVFVIEATTTGGNWVVITDSKLLEISCECVFIFLFMQASWEDERDDFTHYFWNHVFPTKFSK